MKQTIIKLLCLMLALLMTLTIAGCGAKDTSSESADDFDLDFSNDADENDDNDADDAELDDDDLDGDTTDKSDDKTSDKKSNKDSDDSGDTTDKSDNKTSDTKVDKSKLVSNPDSLSLKELMKKIPSSVKGKTLTVYSWNPAKEVTGAEKVIDDFQSKSGIKVKWTTGNYDEYDSKIAAMIASDSAPDIIRYCGPSIHRASLCQDVKTATNYDFSGSIWDSRINSMYTYKNKVYGVNLKNTLVNQPYVILYRKSVFEDTLAKKGYDDPYVLWKNGKWTWTQMIKMAKDYHKLEPSCKPYMSYNHTDLTFLNGNDLIKFNGKKYVNNLQSATVYKQLKQMCDLYADGVTSSAMRHESYFENGQVMFMLFNSIATRKTNAHFKGVKADDDLYAVPVPEMGAKAYPFAEAEAYGICKKAKSKDCAYYFLRYYLDASNYNENGYFCNKQCLDVYKACMKETKFTSSEVDSLLTVVSEGGGAGGISDYIRQGGTSAQLKKEIDSVNPTFELAVKKANEVLAKLD